MHRSENTLWVRWILANAWAELLGLGATFAAVAWLLPRLDSRGITGFLVAFAAAVLSGSLEATVVGLAQW